VVKSDLPFGSEFSPTLLELPRVLELAKEHDGDVKALQAAIRVEYFERNQTSSQNKDKLAMNARLGMKAYGVIDSEARLTDFGERLYDIRGDSAQLYAELARHILLRLNGMALIQCVQDIQASGERVGLVRLRESLLQRGISFPRGGKHPSMMRLWLERAGIFRSEWNVDEARLHDVLGTPPEIMDALTLLTSEQRSYLKALINLGGPGPYWSNEVEKLATAAYGTKFNEKNLPKQVLYPLEKAHLIALARGTKESGRGAKPFLVKWTDTLSASIVVPLLEQIDKMILPAIRPLVRQSLAEIRTNIEDGNTHVKGLALEALGFKLMRLIDLDYVATRLRGDQTGGAEVDLLFESTRLVFSRWQVQCKNTAHVSLDDVAKEVGLIHLLKSNVIVVVSTGLIGTEARRFAGKVMADTNLCVVLIDGDDLAAIEKTPASIVDVLNREARNAMKLKSLKQECSA